MPDGPCESKKGELRERRTAILVIHGIGEQDPYETLDSFGRNLARYLGPSVPLKIRPEKIDHNDWVEACVHLETETGGPKGEPAQIDLYEYYWAPCTEDKITYRESLLWLIRTDLTPLRHLSDNLQALAKTREGAVNVVVPRTDSRVFWREIARIAFLYLPLLVALAWLLSWLPEAAKLEDFALAVADAFKGTDALPRILITLCFATAAVIGFFALRGAWNRVVHRKRHRLFRLDWIRWSLWTAIGFALAGVAAARIWHVSLPAYWAAILNRGTLKLLAVGVFVVPLRYFLKYFVGDVAVYVNADAKSKNYEARTEILQGSTKALSRILRDQKRNYDQVIVAGHSLGSVIAYDTINELVNKAEGAPDQLAGKEPESQVTAADLKKLKGLVTFGSPLDKVYYFFREHVRPDQAIRAQILSYLHSFRKMRSGRDYGPNTFEYYERPEIVNLKWLNAWARADLVSGELHFYRVDVQQRFRYLVPVLAHLSYWEDPEFYRFVSDHLLIA